jgi:hypothetical protein
LTQHLAIPLRSDELAPEVGIRDSFTPPNGEAVCDAALSGSPPCDEAGPSPDLRPVWHRGSTYPPFVSIQPYGPALFRQGAKFVHRILQGQQPNDLLIEQPAKFELAINLKTAKAIGLMIPETFLLRADALLE